jgi:tRNA 2-thiouridine synthesizing protein E
MYLTLDGKKIETDKEGYLQNTHDWSENIAGEIAQKENIVLSNAHWEVIHLLRQFYLEFELSPAMRALVKYMALHLGKEKATSIYLLTLFPPSPAKVASKIAGLPRPINCL